MCTMCLRACCVANPASLTLPTPPPSRHTSIVTSHAIVLAVIVRWHAARFCREPETVVGKPNPLMLSVLSKSAAIDLSRCIMIGDRLDTDIQFGNAAGLTTLLVLTGVSTQQQADALPAGHLQKPHFILPSIAALLPAMTDATVPTPAGGSA